MYSENDIKNLCFREITFRKAEQLYEQGSIQDMTVDYMPDWDILSIEGVVEGSYNNSYHVWLEYSFEDDKIISYECNCPAYEAYEGMCKHCAALALEYLNKTQSREAIEQYKGMNPDAFPLIRTDDMIQDIVRIYANRRRMEEQIAQGTIELQPLLMDSGTSYYYSRRRYSLTFKIGNQGGRMYVLKNMEDFVYAIENDERYSYGKQLSFVHSKTMFTEEAWRYVMLICKKVRENDSYYENVRKELMLSPSLIQEFLLINLNKEVDYECRGRKYKKLYIYDKNPPIKLILREIPGGFVLKIPPLELIQGSSEIFVKKSNSVYKCTKEYAQAISPFLDQADEERELGFKIASEDMMVFCGSVLPELKKQNLLDYGTLELEEYMPKEAEISYYLDAETDKITAKSLCSYGEKQFNLLAPKELSGEYHNIGREQQALGVVKAYFSKEDEKNQVLYFGEEEEDKLYQLLDTGLKQLSELGALYVTDSLKGKRVIRSAKAQVGVALKGGLLELKVAVDAFTKTELAGILDSYQKKKKYYRMKSGDFLNLEEGALATVAELLDGLALPQKLLEEDEYEVPKFRACFIDQILRQKDSRLVVERSADYKAVIRSMKNVEDSDYQVPEHLTGILREYQKMGFYWMSTLADLGFGGILADDMGLGKTIQAIAYMLGRKKLGETTVETKEEKAGETAKAARHLVICPASLVYNWKKEFDMFASGLDVKVIVGTAPQREALIRSGLGDVWITSYDMIKRDINHYSELIFDTEVIDEAQNIKNQGTIASKSVKKIHAKARFALTGTPIENRLSELWSIFDYLMPGILGSYDKFRKTYELPIVQEQDDDMVKRLKRMVSPFILRRLKKDVLKELPDKIEQTVYARMETEQRNIYIGHVERLLESLENKSSMEVQKGKLEILAELTKLRQICCDPALLYDNYLETSCKIDTCAELVQDAIESGHKVLIFSQFTSIFPILGQRLKEEKIAFYKLTGSTPKEKRMEMAEAFNSDDTPVFLISLKAGGTGLNLTAASIVIHFDPWWNLAAQNQATDRAHRIGQGEQVVVFKLIAQDTIEEKIMDLQNTKQKLASQILEGEGISASELTKDDFMEILKF